MLTFLVATYNEERELPNLIHSVKNYVDRIVIVDDGSTDSTRDWILGYEGRTVLRFILLSHTGLPETVKRKGIESELIPKNSWVLMLDCDERMPEDQLRAIKEWVESPESENYTHMYFGLDEYIDGNQTKSFLKCRLFRKNAVRFSDTIHEDDRFEGQGINKGWKIIHRKSSDKQRMREREYLQTYDKLLSEGKITQDRVEWMKALHYFEKG